MSWEPGFEQHFAWSDVVAGLFFWRVMNSGPGESLSKPDGGAALGLSVWCGEVEV